MTKALISDFSRVILFPTDTTYSGSLNEKYAQVKDIPDLNFFEHFKLNNQLLEHLKSYKAKIKVFLFTSDVIQTDPALQPFLQPVFDRVFSASQLGLTKTNPASYTAIANHTGIPPKDLLFFDDSSQNLEAARIAGLETLLYLNNIQLVEDLENRLHIGKG